MNYCLIFLLFVFGSCAGSHKQMRSHHENLSIDANLKNDLKGGGSIELLSHQLLPIDYLRKNPDIHGILINHYMGTGKTFLGIGFIQNFKDKPVLIVAPRFLESHWIEEIKRFGVYNPDRIIFTSYESLPSTLDKIDISNYLVLADEVHNLVKKIRSLNPKENQLYTNSYLKLRQAFKVIGLTGTPVYGDESDLGYMINLVSGLNLMPFNQESFRLAYTEILPVRKFFR